MKKFNQFYAEHDLLMKSQAHKYWKGCKQAALELLEAEMKQASGGRKVTIRKCIKMLKEGL